MTSVEITKEIKRLPGDEQSRVIEFVRHVGENRMLTPEELGALTERMVETKNPAETDQLRDAIMRGFYGTLPHA